jgi:hypothetical protein
MSAVKIMNLLLQIPEKDCNLCLVMKVPRQEHKDSYYGCAPNPSIGINVIHWKYVSDIHVVMPNVHQLYLFRTLGWKHYHCDKDTLLQAVDSSMIAIEVHLYPPTKDVLDSEFVKLINVGYDRTTKNVMLSVPWKKIASLVHKNTVAPIKKKKKAHVSKKAAGTLKCQKFHKDVEYTTGQCLIGKDNLGVSVPLSKPLSDKLHIKVIVALSALF